MSLSEKMTGAESLLEKCLSDDWDDGSSIVDGLIEGEEKLSDAELLKFLERIWSNQERVERRFWRSLTVMMALWLFAAGTSLDALSRASFMGIQAENLRAFLPYLPVPIGLLHYSVLASWAMRGNCAVVAAAIFRRRWPYAYLIGILDQLEPPSILSIDTPYEWQILEKENTVLLAFEAAIDKLRMFSLAFGPWIIILHIFFLTVESSRSVHEMLSVYASLVLALVVSSRGLFVVLSYIKTRSHFKKGLTTSQK